MVYVASLVLAVLLALLAIQVLHICIAYQSATGTPWQRFLSAFGHSQTVLLARVATFLAGASVWAVNFLPDLDPSNPIGQYVRSLLPPQYSTYYALGFAVLVELVRRAPGSLDPVTVPPQAINIPLPPSVADIEAATLPVGSELLQDVSALIPKA